MLRPTTEPRFPLTTAAVTLDVLLLATTSIPGAATVAVFVIVPDAPAATVPVIVNWMMLPEERLKVSLKAAPLASTPDAVVKVGITALSGVRSEEHTSE